MQELGISKYSPSLPEPGSRGTSREGCWERTGITRSSSFEREGSGSQRLGVPRINERRSRSAEPRKIKPLDINKPVIRHLKQQFMVSSGTGKQNEAHLWNFPYLTDWIPYPFKEKYL